MKTNYVVWSACLLCGPLMLPAQTVPAPHAGPMMPANAVVIPFVIAGSPASGDPVAAKACPAGVPSLPAEQMDDAQKVVAAIAQEMQDALKTHLPAQLAQANQTIAPGTLVFSGCLTGVKRGSAAARSISVGAGGSQVLTHVRIFTTGPGGTEVNLHEYDLVTKGTNYGGGLFVGLARVKRTSVEGDGKHAADQIVEKYFAEPGANSKNAEPAATPPTAVTH